MNDTPTTAVANWDAAWSAVWSDWLTDGWQERVRAVSDATAALTPLCLARGVDPRPLHAAVHALEGGSGAPADGDRWFTAMTRHYEAARLTVSVVRAAATPLAEPAAVSQLGATHSADFASVYWFGTRYEFTPAQARCVRALWAAWRNGTPVLRQAELQEEADVSSGIRGVFQRHPAWRTMIVSPGKGQYRLAEKTFDNI